MLTVFFHLCQMILPIRINDTDGNSSPASSLTRTNINTTSGHRYIHWPGGSSCDLFICIVDSLFDCGYSQDPNKVWILWIWPEFQCRCPLLSPHLNKDFSGNAMCPRLTHLSSGARRGQITGIPGVFGNEKQGQDPALVQYINPSILIPLGKAHPSWICVTSWSASNQSSPIGMEWLSTGKQETFPLALG